VNAAAKFSRSLLFALSDDLTRPHLCRVHVQAGEARATDGHRLHAEPMPGVPDGDYSPEGERLGDVDAACFATCLRPEVVRVVELCTARPDAHYRSAVALLRAEMIGWPKALTLAVPIGPGDWRWHVTISSAAEKARLKGPAEVHVQPAQLAMARPAWWGGADAEGPAVYVRAEYLLDALCHADNGSETVGLAADLLAPVVVAGGGRTRWAIVMPVRP